MFSSCRQRVKNPTFSIGAVLPIWHELRRGEGGKRHHLFFTVFFLLFGLSFCVCRTCVLTCVFEIGNIRLNNTTNLSFLVLIYDRLSCEGDLMSTPEVHFWTPPHRKYILAPQFVLPVSGRLFGMPSRYDVTPPTPASSWVVEPVVRSRHVCQS